jgi:hypothetical protein
MEGTPHPRDDMYRDEKMLGDNIQIISYRDETYGDITYRDESY